jgi:hypothetical protein
MTWTVVFNRNKFKDWDNDPDNGEDYYGAYIIEADEKDAVQIFERETGMKFTTTNYPDGEGFVSMEFPHLEEAEFAACTDRVLYLSR